MTLPTLSLPTIAMAAGNRPVAALILLLGLTCGVAPPLLAQLQPPTSFSVVRITNPADVGMSAARLDKLTTAFNKEIADKALPGVTIMVARKGKVVYSNAFGVRDAAKGDAMSMDSLFRIYSMTKPMASVAAMIPLALVRCPPRLITCALPR